MQKPENDIRAAVTASGKTPADIVQPLVTSKIPQSKTFISFDIGRAFANEIIAPKVTTHIQIDSIAFAALSVADTNADENFSC